MPRANSKATKQKPVAPDEALSVNQEADEALSVKTTEALSVEDKPVAPDEVTIDDLAVMLNKTIGLLVHVAKNAGQDATVRHHGFKTHEYTQEELKGRLTRD